MDSKFFNEEAEETEMFKQLEKLDDLLYGKPRHKYDGLGGDIGGDGDMGGNSDTFLKAMSGGGKRDHEIGEKFEQWLKEKNVKYTRFQDRKFTIDTPSFFVALKTL